MVGIELEKCDNMWHEGRNLVLITNKMKILIFSSHTLFLLLHFLALSSSGSQAATVVVVGQWGGEGDERSLFPYLVLIPSPQLTSSHSSQLSFNLSTFLSPSCAGGDGRSEGLSGACPQEVKRGRPGTATRTGHSCAWHGQCVRPEQTPKQRQPGERRH